MDLDLRLAGNLGGRKGWIVWRFFFGGSNEISMTMEAHWLLGAIVQRDGVSRPSHFGICEHDNRITLSSVDLIDKKFRKYEVQGFVNLLIFTQKYNILPLIVP